LKVTWDVWLLAARMPSTHMRGLPRLCVDVMELGDVRVMHVCGSCVSLRMMDAYAWFSTHMRAEDGLLSHA
ncbi:hypothetical protein PIB30_109837, partial [Stylosanthes scabra]|nr:hypothetical protein [Stylosanthes scabra]